LLLGAKQAKTGPTQEFSQVIILLFLRHLGLWPGRPEPPSPRPEELGRAVYLTAEGRSCWEPMVRPGQTVSKGQLLGRTFDFFGKIIEERRAEFDGVALYITRALSANPGNVLVCYAEKPSEGR
jgi:predicted deacylase